MARRKQIRIDDAIGYRVHRSARLLRVHFLRMAREGGFDLPPEQWFVLNKLNQRDGQTPSELADDIFRDRPNLTRMLKSMERKGWIARRADDGDGRSVRIHLTAAGRQLHGDFEAIVLRERKRVYRGLSSDDFAELARILGRLEQNIVEIMADA